MESNGRLGSHLPWESAVRALNSIGYTGPISVEWVDAAFSI